MKKIHFTLLPIATLFFLLVSLFTVQPLVASASPADEVGKGITAAGDSDDKNCENANGANRKCTLTDSVNTVTSVLLFVIGTVSVIMIIIGGLRYTTSNGDSSQITAAKNTILYSVIGLVVALLAFAIVRFVVTEFTK